MTTISTRIYESLAEKIIDGTLKPGEKLDERTLAENYNVSRTPIREALRELGVRGLVEMAPRRAGVVACIGVDRLSVLLEADGELEALCARRSAQYMTLMERKELEFLHEQSAEYVQRNDSPGYLAINQQFHKQLCIGAHNDVIATMVEDLRKRLAPFRQAQPHVEERFTVSHSEHSAIVEAILKRDPEAAYQAMSSHNARLSTTVIRIIKQSQAFGASSV